jgi:hypothetical protein
VFLPIADRGRTISTADSAAARTASASIEISIPGASTPAEELPFAETTSMHPVAARKAKQGRPTYLHRVGPVVDVAGYQTLRSVVFGGSFEGLTTFGVGVRARLPFRVFALAGPGGDTRIVLDVLHKWDAGR